MKSTLVVVADLACLKAFKLDNNHLHSTPRLELLEHYDNPAAHGRLVDQVSDLSGRFGRGSAASSGMSDGERHNIQLEQRKRLVRRLAERLNKLAGKPEVERCFLAVSKEINHLLVDELDSGVKAKIFKNLAADLTKLERSEILRHF